MRSATGARILWTASTASLALSAVISGCSSSSSPSGGGGGDGGGSSSGGSSSGGSSSGGATDGGSDAVSDAEAGASTESEDGSCTTLKLYNFESWCSVGFNGAATFASAEQTACLQPGSVTLLAKPASASFELGPEPWVYISGTGGTTTGTSGAIVGDGGVGSTSTVTVNLGSTPGCVLVCCPFTDGTGCSASQTGYTAWLANCP